MSYYRELKDFILQLKGGGHFLSPRDVWFLKFLEEEGYPLEVIREGIKKFFLFHPPEKRSKLPLFMSFREIQKLRRLHMGKASGNEDWRERFLRKVRLAEEILKRELNVHVPEDLKEAEDTLQRLEGEMAKKIWEGLSREEKASILRRFSSFKGDEELFKSMVKRELFRRKGLKGLSLFVD
ncbi:MAG: hypothetical protein ACK42C_00475 [Aquificaceae bacterium]|jgi:hypothetical protein|uniref:hypothetical protein n=1 Tax=Hydrogenobacter sp. Uz 6-8 TaxID=3384828 RepID=UPI000F1C04A7|nr:MAG: hypothetical protein D6804_02050 [Aquificota bacterium]